MKALRFFTGTIVLGIVIGLAANRLDYLFVNKGVYEDAFKIVKEFVPLILILIGVSGLVYLFYSDRQKMKKFKKLWRFAVPSNKVQSNIFNVPNYNKTKIRREADELIQKKLQEGKNIIITGKASIGKSRTAFDEISKLKKCVVIIPFDRVYDELDEIKIPYFPFAGRKKIIILLDEINQIENSESIKDIYFRLKEIHPNVTIAATCRAGYEFFDMKQKFPKLYHIFANDIVELKNIKQEEAVELAKSIGKEDEIKNFDGTPGSITLGLGEMKKIFESKLTNEQKIILKTIKILYAAQNTRYSIERIKELSTALFRLPNSFFDRYNLDPLLEQLYLFGFLTEKPPLDTLKIIEPYIETCVDYEPTEKDFTELENILAKKRDSGGLNLLARSHNYRKQYKMAETCFKKALEIFPKYASAMTGLGYSLTKLGEIKEESFDYIGALELYNEAVRYYNMSIEMDGSYEIDYNNLGYTLSHIGEIFEQEKDTARATSYYQKAEKCHTKAIELDKYYSAAYYSRAYARNKLGNNEGCEEDMKSAIAIEPDSPYFHAHLAYFYANTKGNFAEAQKYYEKALEIEPDYPNALINYAHLLKENHRENKAIEMLKRVIEKNPYIARAHVILGRIYMGKKLHNDAIPCFEKAIKINPKYIEPYMALGWLYTGLSLFQDAENNYSKALQINPSHFKANLNFGVMLTEAAEAKYLERDYVNSESYFLKAEKKLKAALNINKNNVDVYKCITWMYEKWFKYKLAKQYYDLAFSLNLTGEDFLFQYAHFLYKRLAEFEKASEILNGLHDKNKSSKVLDRINDLNNELIFFKIQDIAERIERKDFQNKEKLIGHLKTGGEEIEHLLGYNDRNIKAWIGKGVINECYAELITENRDSYLKEAEKIYRDTIGITYRYHSVHWHLGVLLLKQNRLEEAEKEFKYTEEIAPYYAKNYLNYGILLLKMKKEKEAASKLEKARRLFEEQNNLKNLTLVNEILSGIKTRT